MSAFATLASVTFHANLAPFRSSLALEPALCGRPPLERIGWAVEVIEFASPLRAVLHAMPVEQYPQQTIGDSLRSDMILRYG
jgi:hypothetical protein